MDDQQLFMNNLKGSTAANAITGIMFIIFYIVKNKCKHSQCESHTWCFTCSVKEDDCDERERIPEEGQNIPGEIEINVREMYPEQYPSLSPRYKKAIPFARKRRRHSFDGCMATKKQSEGEV